MSKGSVVADAGKLPDHHKTKPEIPHERDENPQPGVEFTQIIGCEPQFVEERSEIDDPLEYTRKGSDQGLVVIFNHENFRGEKHERRTGSHRDVYELTVTLGRLRFNIDKNFIYNDLSRRDVLIKIDEICKMDLKDRNCLICIFLSHGAEDNKLMTYDAQVTVDEIYEPFANCDDLRDKPKFFLFQACKAEKFQNTEITAVDGDTYNRKIVCDRTLLKEIPSDILLVYSTIEGEISFRDTKYGSWFIQELCRNFTAYGRRDDVISLVMRTTKCVANNYRYEEEGIRAKQLPIFVSTLTKKFYLTKSKERLQLLYLMERIKDITLKVDYLNTKINSLSIPE